MVGNGWLDLTVPLYHATMAVLHVIGDYENISFMIHCGHSRQFKYLRLLAAWAENNYLQVRLKFLEFLDYVCLRKQKLKLGELAT